MKPPYFYTPDIGQAQYDAGTQEGRHIPVFEDTEGETEQKKGNGKEEARQEMKQLKIQTAGERIQISAKALFNIKHEREGNKEEVEFRFKMER